MFKLHIIASANLNVHYMAHNEIPNMLYRYGYSLLYDSLLPVRPPTHLGSNKAALINWAGV